MRSRCLPLVAEIAATVPLRWRRLKQSPQIYPWSTTTTVAGTVVAIVAIVVKSYPAQKTDQPKVTQKEERQRGRKEKQSQE